MLHLYICEDNALHRQQLVSTIEKIILMENFDLTLKCATADPDELCSVASSANDTGLYFLDIDLHAEINGLELAQKIRQFDMRGFIVFVTTHSEMCSMTFSYKVEAMDFIVKDDIENLHERILQCIQKAYERYSSPNNQTQPVFRISTRDREQCIPYDHILFFETTANAHKVLLHTYDGFMEIPGQLKQLELQLSSDPRFCRCHRCFLINCDHILHIDMKTHMVTLDNQETCLASSKGIKLLLHRPDSP